MFGGRCGIGHLSFEYIMTISSGDRSKLRILSPGVLKRGIIVWPRDLSGSYIQDHPLRLVVAGGWGEQAEDISVIPPNSRYGALKKCLWTTA